MTRIAASHEQQKGFVRSARILLFALVACVALGVFAVAPAYGESVIHWAGSLTAGGEGRFYADDTRVDTVGTLRLQARTLTFPLRAFFDGRLRLAGPVIGEGAWGGQADVDRLYLRLYLPFADLTLGRQFVNWGVGYAWSPTDVFNPPDPTDPQGIRRGIDAVVAQIPVGPLDHWTVALADARYGVRRRGYASGTDWSVAAVSGGGDTVVGADLKGDLGVGWHAAAAHRIPGALAGEPTTTLLVGADYSWLAGNLFWVGEYLVETSGGDTAQHTFQQITYRLNDFTSINGTLLAPLQGGARWWSASYRSVLSAQSELRLALTLLDGVLVAPMERARLGAEFVFTF